MNNKNGFGPGEYVYSTEIEGFGTIVGFKRGQIYIVKNDTYPHCGETHEASAEQLRHTRHTHIGNIGDGDS